MPNVAVPVHVRLTTICPLTFALRVTVKTIGSGPCSEPFASVAATETVGGASLSEIAPIAFDVIPLAGNLVGDDGSLHKFVNVYRNDDDIRYLDQLDTPVSDGDEIAILPAVAGGIG